MTSFCSWFPPPFAVHGTVSSVHGTCLGTAAARTEAVGRSPSRTGVAPISFTYHLPLCRSTTDIPYVISSFDAVPRFPRSILAVRWRGPAISRSPVICGWRRPAGREARRSSQRSPRRQARPLTRHGRGTGSARGHRRSARRRTSSGEYPDESLEILPSISDLTRRGGPETDDCWARGSWRRLTSGGRYEPGCAQAPPDPVVRPDQVPARSINALSPTRLRLVRSGPGLHRPRPRPTSRSFQTVPGPRQDRLLSGQVRPE